MNWYLGVLKQYAVFTGRARRAEFWWFVLISIIITVVLSMVDRMTGTMRESGYGLLSGLYALAVLLPTIGVAIRRLHDTNRTGWWLLLGFIPIVGFIVLIVFYCIEGDPGPNQYGPSPKGA